MVGVTNFIAYGTFGGGFGNLLFRFQQMGFFDYVLPFLFIFILVFAILEKTNILGSSTDKKTGINAILGIAIGLMALQFQFVSYFFAEIFPRLGIFLAIMVVAMICLALFFDFNISTTKQVFGWVAGLVVVVIIGQSLNAMSFFGSFGTGQVYYWWQRNSDAILILGFIGLVILGVVSSGRKQPEGKKHTTLGDLLLKREG